FLRLPFELSDPDAVSGLSLRMRWNDGFVAYLNGTKVAADRNPAEPAWNSLATSARSAGENDDWVSFPIDLPEARLQAGENLLAIQGMNHAVDSPDLLVFPELEIVTGGI
ncbi:MAG: hypothetical protein GWO24_38070, partial [Akkermansiaceae bacterium]|nr:hypothetical protein [Akkermansiaceae bacterium]